jgi:predicted histone-like DNA-binding protein
MPISYKIVKQCQPGKVGGGQWKYYARACKRRKLSLYDLSREIERRTSLSVTDVIAAVTAFTEIIPDKLKNGHTVDLGSLGILSLSVKSKGQETLEEVTAKCISGVQINFRPSVQMKREMESVKFVLEKE